MLDQGLAWVCLLDGGAVNDATEEAAVGVEVAEEEVGVAAGKVGAVAADAGGTAAVAVGGEG